MNPDDKKYDYTYVVLSPVGWVNFDAFGKLLKEGWKPLRETPNQPSSTANSSHWLCILSREKTAS